MRLKTRKTRSRKKIEEIDDAESNGAKLQYRCTLQGIHALYNEIKFKLKKGHHDAFEKTPFKHLFKALHDDEIVKEKKKDEMLDDLILCYDKKAEKFKFGSEFHKPTRLDVKLIFGIEDGTEDVGKITHHRRGESTLQARRFANEFRVTVKKLKDKIKELVDNEDQESIDDTVKLLCVIILSNVLFPNTGAYIAWGFLYYVDDFDRLKSYDWSQHVLDELMNGLHDDWSYPKQVNGCILLLPYWFCEHLDNVPDMHKNGIVKEPMITGGQGISSKGIPRLTKWKLKNLDQLIEISVLYKMDTKLFNNNELIPTIAEEHLIKSLSTKPKAMNIVMEHNLGLEQSPAVDEILMDVTMRKSKRVKRVMKNKEESSGDSAEGPGVERGYTSEGNQESEATQVHKDIESYEESEDNSEGKSYAEARKVCDQDKPKKKKESGKTVTVLGKRKERFTKVNIKEKNVRNSSKRKSIAEARKVHVEGLKKDDKTKKLEEEISRLKGTVDSLKREQVNLIKKQETMAAEHFEMEMALGEEVTKKTELLCELENEKLASKNLLNELTLAKIKNDKHEDKAKENESVVQNLQIYIQNLVQGSGSQSFGQESIQQQEMDGTMIELLGGRVAAEHFEMEMTLDEETMAAEHFEMQMLLDEETMAAEHFEMEMALDEESTKKTELLCELENEKLARKNLMNELTLAKMKNEHHEDKAKENESVVQNLQTYVQKLVQGSGSQNFGQESIQQKEVDKAMIDSPGERVARLEYRDS